jgi:DNA-binding LacI/PurR family transcriptional regulator
MLLEIAVPVVVMGQLPGLVAPLVITVGGASDVPATTATQHLLSLGHQTVHHVAGPQVWFSARERQEGWARALRSAGRNGTSLQGDWSVASGYAAGKHLARDPNLTAVFAANDDMAIGVIHALVEAGRPVPDEVSVVGFDDIPLAAYLNPPLTTIRLPFDEMTTAAVQALVHGIENPDDTTHTRLDPTMQLVIRQSSAPPPTRPQQRA